MQKHHKTEILINHTGLSSTGLNITHHLFQSLVKTGNQNTPLQGISEYDTHDFDSKIFKLLCDKC